MTETTGNVKRLQEYTFPKGFMQLFHTSDVKNPCEGFIILLHTLLLEVGYIPKDVEEDAFSSMPGNWKMGDFFKIQYYHNSLPEALCWVTCVPLYKKLSINGTVENEQAEDNAYCTVEVNKYVNMNGDLSDPSSIFIKVKELSRVFKDEFCFPLLVHLQESVECKATFGLNGLVDEVKTVVLKLLPVESIITLSSVNKDFHNLTNSSYLWKYLFIRDYGEVESTSSSSTNENWKEMYKTEYQRRKARHAFRPHHGLYHPYHIPEIFPVAPSFGVDMRINMDPALQEAFPLVRSRFRPNWFFPGGLHYLDDY